MKEANGEEEAPPELVVPIIWRQWEDGSWEVVLADEEGPPAQQGRSPAELERFLAAARQAQSSASRNERDLKEPIR